MLLKHFVGLAAVAAAAGACATADPLDMNLAESGPVCSDLGMIDRDNDGILARDEWGAFRAGAFNDWDHDDDLRLSRTEFENCWRNSGFMAAGFNEEWWDDNFALFDDDGDGFLGSNEFFGDDEFGLLDRDRDLGIETGVDEWTF